MAYYAVFDGSDLFCITIETDGYDAFDLVELTGVTSDTVEFVTWNGTGTTLSDFAIDTSVVIDQLKTKAALEADALAATYLTAQMTYAYAMKGLEVYRWDLLTTMQQDALTTDEKKDQFPYAHFDAVKFGDTVRDAITRFRQGAVAANQNLAAIEAERQYAVSVAKAETTITDMVAVVVAEPDPDIAAYVADESAAVLQTESGADLLV